MRFMNLFSSRKWFNFLNSLIIKIVLTKLWRRRNIFVGRNVTFWGKPVITNKDKSSIIIGNDCVICSTSTETALGVSHKTIFRTLKQNALLKIGNGVRMSGAVICSAEMISIGDRCVIGSNVTISDTDFHSLDPKIRSSSQDHLLAITKPVSIANDVFIGGGSIILKGVVIGEGAVIGAGSVITNDVPPNTIYAGNPARFIRKLI